MRECVREREKDRDIHRVHEGARLRCCTGGDRAAATADALPNILF